MEGTTSWISHSNSLVRENVGFDSFLELDDEGKEECAQISLDIMPDDLLRRIFLYLPVTSILRVGGVCKRWYEIVSSRKFMLNFSHMLSQAPWYYMFTTNNEPVGHAYDPIFKKWYSIELPHIQTPNWCIASSCGLVCFMDNDCSSEIYVCNPITKDCRRLQEPPGIQFSYYGALAISVNQTYHKYNVSIVKSKQVPGDYFQWDLSIHLYDSETMMWVTLMTEILSGWRTGDESVICDGVLYFLIYSTAVGVPDNRHGLITYNLSSQPSHGLLTNNFIPVPCPLTCGRLMNLNEKLIMVGGIGKHDRTDIIIGIGIWALNGKAWQVISRMPHKFFHGFGEVDEVFACSGMGDLIYIHSFGAPSLLLFDLSRKQWKWAQKCPVAKPLPLQLFTGFCFEPRLESAP